MTTHTHANDFLYSATEMYGCWEKDKLNEAMKEKMFKHQAL